MEDPSTQPHPHPGPGESLTSAPAAVARPVRVWIVDDHEAVRRGLRELLCDTGGIEILGESATAAEASHDIPAHTPDVVLLDVRLPDGSGIEVCRRLRAQNPLVRALMVTSYDDPDALVAAILAGASGYVLKQIRGADLAEAVRRVAAGQSLLDAETARRARYRLRDRTARDPRLAALTARERRTLDLIADGLTNREIADVLNVAEQTVKNHVSTVMTKLNVDRRTPVTVSGVSGSRPRPRLTPWR